MDLGSMSGTESQYTSHDTHQPHPQSPPPASHHRRHSRYTITATAIPPSPQVIIDARSHHSPRNRRNHTAMNTSPPSSAVASSSQAPGVTGSESLHEAGGQNHDRMETDEESEKSDSDPEDDTNDTGEPPGRISNGTETPRPNEDEVMDTSPDNPPIDETVPPPPPENNSQTSPTSVGTFHLSANFGTEPPPTEATTPMLPSLHLLLGDATRTQPQIQISIDNAAMENAVLREQLAEARRRQVQQEGGQLEEESRDEDDDSDDSMDEPDRPFWARFPEDTSIADATDLSYIEGYTDDISGLDHEHWEKSTFEALDDPEHIPGDVGRISWTVKGIHGTPENPNRKEIMRSPAVCIGGLYWNIKFFPRGNETDQMSVYVECSPTAPEPPQGEASAVDVEANTNMDGDHDAQATTVEGSSSALESATTDPLTDVHADDVESSPASAEGDLSADGTAWGIAAQFACVVYNPQEPRVNAYQKSSHFYYEENPDWGWTRFYGPWNEMHQRKRYQRQAFLRNDTLAFTVYIRLVQDHTKTLWWHAPENQPQWDSVSMTGMRAMECKEFQSTAVVSAVSAWMHLGFFVRKLCGMQIPIPKAGTDIHLRPVLKELQEIIFDEGLHTQQTTSSDIRLAPLVNMLDYFYRTGIAGSKMDVVMIWETIRRIVSLEVASFAEVKKASNGENDIFEDILMLKQPDPFHPEYSGATCSPQPRNIDILPVGHEPSCVQEALDVASQHPNRAFRVWQGSAEGEIAQTQRPLVLQIELHRQKFEKDSRKWRKLTHRIGIDETITFNSHQYTLYGMIVHSGGLDYNEYSTVVRPEGPGTRWLKYVGDGSARGVTILTTKQAVNAHEGGSSEETTAVAYVVLYVLSVQVSEILSTAARRSVLQDAQKKSEASALQSDQAQLAKAMSFQIGSRYWLATAPFDPYQKLREIAPLRALFCLTEKSADGEPMQEPQSSEELASPATNRETQSSGVADQLYPEISFFLKSFECEAQTLRMMGKYTAERYTKVVPYVRGLLKLRSGEALDVYHEHSLVIKPRDIVKSSSTLQDYCPYDTTFDGMIFIVQRRPSSADIASLEIDGKCTNPIEYIDYLRGHYDPKFFRSHFTSSYFAQDYRSYAMKYGRPHGFGTIIPLSGDSYTGNFTVGKKCGQGTMAYTNGDTYSGEWRADEPNGQGKMVYAKTGNVYTGGFKKRKRHGKGRMEYEVADEEMQLCSICYEKEMDAIFCFCGHVTACEECARKVDICPVCRADVKRVITLKGANGGRGGIVTWGGGSEGGGGVGVM